MKKLFPFVVTVICLLFGGCRSDEPEQDDSTGKLIVHLQQEGAEGVDFAEYSIAIVPEQGFIPSAAVKDIEWPVEVKVGVYTIAAASPKVAETETTESWFYGEVKDVRILKDQTTEVTVPLTLKVYPKAD